MAESYLTDLTLCNKFIIIQSMMELSPRDPQFDLPTDIEAYLNTGLGGSLLLCKAILAAHKIGVPVTGVERLKEVISDGYSQAAIDNESQVARDVLSIAIPLVRSDRIWNALPEILCQDPHTRKEDILGVLKAANMFGDVLRESFNYTSDEIHSATERYAKNTHRKFNREAVRANLADSIKWLL